MQQNSRFKDRVQDVLGQVLFEGKASLFFTVVLMLVVSIGVEIRFVKSHIVDIKPTFYISELEGDVNLRRNDELLPLSIGEVDIRPGDALITYTDSELVLEVNQDGYLALDSHSVLEFDQLKMYRSNQYESLEKARLYLESGRLWVNNVFNPVGYNIYTNKVLVVPGDAAFEMDYNGAVLHVYNNQHDLNVGLLAKPYSELERAGEVDDLFYNYFYLPAGNRIQISEAKVSEKLARLLLSKLVKEFPMSLVLKDDLEKDRWYEKHRKRSTELANTYVLAYAESLSDTIAFKRLHDLQELYLLHIVRNSFPFVFSEAKSVRNKEEFLSQVFDIGQTWSLSDDVRESDRNAEQFYSFWQSSLSFLNFDSRRYLAGELSELQGVLHTSVLYPGKQRVWDAQFAELREKRDYGALIQLLSDNLEEVYDLMDTAEYVRALEAFTSWNARLNLFLGSYKSEELYEFYPDVEAIRQSVTNLFFRYYDFYTLEHFDSLTYIDQKVLEISPDQLEQEENRQMMVQDRIKLLKQLSYLIQNGKIDLEQGVELGEAMLANVQTLRGQALYRVAIYDYFDSEIAAQVLLFEFYMSPEYALLKGSFEEAFAEFQQRRADWLALQGYLKELGPSRKKVKRVDTDNLIAEVYEQFVERAIFPDSIGVVGDMQDRLFEIQNGKIGQQDFSGMFDNKTKLIYDLVVNGQNLSKGVHIDKLREVVNSIVLVSKEGVSSSDTNDLVFGEEFTDDIRYSSAESLAVTLAVSELNEAGFFVSKQDVEIIDLLANRFYIENVALDEFAHTLTFEFDNIKDQLTQMMVVVTLEEGGEEIRLDGTFDPVGLASELDTRLEDVIVVPSDEAAAEHKPGRVKRKVSR